jgi:hypothetical protein
MFLRTAGGLTLGLPFLPSLLPRTLHAQPAPAPRRFFAIQSYSGQRTTDWLPAAAPAGFRMQDAVFPGTNKADGTVYLHERIPGTTAHGWAQLTDFATAAGISNVLGASLNPYLGKMNLLRGIDFLQGCGHADGAYYGNYAACSNGDEFSMRGLGHVPTIDQVMAYSDRLYPSPPKMRSLNLVTGSPNSFSYTDYGIAGGEVENVQGYLDPHDAWQDLFGDFMETAMPVEDPNRRLVNAIYQDYARLREHRRLGADDRQTLERHMTFLSDLERELGALPAAGCMRPGEPPSIENGYPWAEVSSIEDFQATVRLFIDIAVAAIRCDLTRVVTFNVQEALTDGRGAWANSYHNSADVAGDWHQFAHDAAGDPDAARNLLHINKWIADAVFARLLEQLDVEEADGRTYLDNSLVCWGAELMHDHYCVSLPTLLAGSAGGALTTGHYVDYIDWTVDYANPIDWWGVLIPGLPHNRLMVTLLQAMGLSPADYERDGRRGYGLTEMFANPYNWPEDYDMSRIGEPLPGLFAG